MSSLRCCEYRELEGKTIRRVRWSNDLDCYELGIVFSDGTHVSFKFSLTLREDSQLMKVLDSTLTDCRSLIATPVRGHDIPLEGR